MIPREHILASAKKRDHSVEISLCYYCIVDTEIILDGWIGVARIKDKMPNSHCSFCYRHSVGYSKLKD